MESQIESAEQKRARGQPARPTPEQASLQREREHLELSRTGVLRDLAATNNPRYRELLEATLHHLDEKLRTMDEAKPGDARP